LLGSEYFSPYFFPGICGNSGKAMALDGSRNGQQQGGS
jgi:hypothetical protein